MFPFVLSQAATREGGKIEEVGSPGSRPARQNNPANGRKIRIHIRVVIIIGALVAAFDLKKNIRRS